MVTETLVRAPEATTAARPAQGAVEPPWRHWRGWLAVAVVVAAGVVIVAGIYQRPSPQYLNPESTAPTGTHALADILAGLGREVQTETSVPSAIAAATAGTTLVITSPSYLSPVDLKALAHVRANVLLVGPDPPALAAIAPYVALTGQAQPVLITPPACTLPAAQLAGTVDTGGEQMFVLDPSEAVAQCYPTQYGPTLVQTRVGGRLVTVLSAGVPLTNADLASQGNAALAINLLATRRIVWLVPPPATEAALAAPSGPNARAAPKSLFSLLPLTVYLVAAQLAFALLLAIGWRARRLGPLVSEPLPVVVPAAETVIGHGRLYRARHARGKAAAALRGTLLARLAPAVGLPAVSAPDAMVDAVASRSTVGQERIRELLYGPPPRSDAALLVLARDLDQLAREVGLS